MKRWLKRLGWALLALVGVVLLVVGGALVFLQTGAGGKWARDQVVTRANEAIKGSLEVDSVRLRGFTLVLEGVRLFDPEGELVAEVERLSAAVRPGQLLSRTVHVEAVEVTRPGLYLVQEADGLNLQRAIEPVEEKPEEPKEDKPLPVDLVLEALRLEDGQVSYVSRTGAEPFEAAVDGLNMQGHAALRERGERLEAGLEVTAQLDAPARGPIRISLRADGQGETTNAAVDGELAGLRLRAQAKVEGEERLTATVEELVVPPAFARAFSPAYPLRVSLRAEGEAQMVADEVAADLTFRAGTARIDAELSANLLAQRAERVEVRASGIDLSELVARGPKSDVSFTLEGKGGGASLETLNGELTLTAPPSPMAGETFGPLELRARAEDGRLVLEKLEAVMPGVALTARGEKDGETVRLYARLAARSLGTFAQTLGKLAGPEGLPLSGTGALALRVEGPLEGAGPKLEATGRFPALQYDAHRLRDVRLWADVEGLRAPLAGDLRVGMQAGSAKVGGRALTRPRLSLQLAQRRLSLAATTRGSVRLDLAGRGVVDADGQGLTLSRLSLRYPEARWALESEAKLRFDDDGLLVDGLALRSGRQRLAVDAVREGGRLKARGQVEALALDRLPKDLVQLEVALAGRLDLDVRAEGRASAPVVTARGTLADGRYGEVGDIDLSVEAKYASQTARAQGQVRAGALGAEAHLDFDLPLTALRTGATSAAVSADLVLKEVALGDLARALGEVPPAEGTFSGRAKLRGTARTPSLDAALTVKALQAGAHPPVDADFTLESGGGGKLEAALVATVEGEVSTLAVKTPWTLGRLLRRPPTAEQAMRAPLVITGTLRRLPLPYEDPSAPLGAQARFARLSGDIDVRGAALDPRGEVALRLEEFGFGELSPLRATTTLTLAAKAQRLEAEVTQGERTLLVADARVDAALSALRKKSALRRMPISLNLEAGPVALPDLQALVPKSEHPAEESLPPLRGLLQARLLAEGTLEAPRVDAGLSVHGLGGAEAPTQGDLSVRFEHARGQSQVGADLLSEGGELRLRGAAPISLSLSSLERGVDFRNLPVKASLQARAFDPSFLSATSPMLLEVGGRVDAAAEVEGPIRLPRVKGAFNWKDGVLALTGQGRYTDIRMRVEGTQDRIALHELFARGGEGSATLSGTLDREGDGAVLTASANLKDFPVVSDFQRVATVTLRAEAEGTANLDQVVIRPLRIPEAVVMLPPNSRRALHDIEPPANVAFYFAGEPLSGGKGEEKAQRTDGASATGGGAEAGQSALPEIVVHLEADRNLWVRGEDLNVEVGFGEDFRVVMAEAPLLFGELHVRRGRVDVMGRRFDLDPESVVTFTGPMMAPRLNVVATHENRREEVLVTLRVTGQGEELEIQPSSDPPLTETEIYTLIATGRRSLRPGGESAGAGSAAATALGSLATAQLQKQLRNTLPLDVLTIEQGEEGVGTARVEAGTYVNDRLYLGIASEIGAQLEQGENRNELLLEYQLWRRWMLELEYGDARKGGADLMWRKQY